MSDAPHNPRNIADTARDNIMKAIAALKDASDKLKVPKGTFDRSRVEGTGFFQAKFIVLRNILSVEKEELRNTGLLRLEALVNEMQTILPEHKTDINGIQSSIGSLFNRMKDWDTNARDDLRDLTP